MDIKKRNKKYNKYYKFIYIGVIVFFFLFWEWCDYTWELYNRNW